MPLKKHHKIMIGGVSSLLIIVLIANTIFLYFLYAQLQISNNKLENQITELQTDTQSKINELTTNIIDTQKSVSENLSSLDKSLNLEIDELKATAGDDFSGIAKEAVKSVVTIRTNVGQGTGFIITEEGYIVTNAHVLSGGIKINAITYEQETKNAEFIGYDGNLDIALLKISGNYQELELANSDQIRIGEKVIAIGNPLGLQFSISEGIVSAVNRPGINEIKAYIQTDAALNPGNSGGPLINKQGKVIGINNFKVGGGESLGFALESNYIREVINDISQKVLNQTLI
ncbi:MAG: trypsin-like peptidase domain-containing protein [archaeon]